MDLFKNFAAAMDRRIERERHMQNADWRKQANQRVMEHVADMIATGRAREIKCSDIAKICDPKVHLDWDYEPSPYAGFNNGEVGS